MRKTSVDPHIFVILGATGDLSLRKLFPALYNLLETRKLKETCQVLGVGNMPMEQEAFREKVRDALVKAGRREKDVSFWCDSCVHYQALKRSGKDFGELLSAVTSIEKKHNLPGNRIFYLALPPPVFPAAIKGIGSSGLNKSTGWIRLVVEKPFGNNLSSSRDLNRGLHDHFEEAQIFRIDHYLGKETVQNLLIFRFANTMFESLWNRDRVDSVEITVAESLGIGERAGYYDQSGALRDIVQNHLTQLLCLVAMDAPSVFKPEMIRDEKLKVLQSLQQIKPEDVVFGQYKKGEMQGKRVPGYREERGISKKSLTETFVAARVFVDNWRWQGVPFYLRTGKRLPERITHVVVNFEYPPVCLFKPYSTCSIRSNKLLITLQPDEGFHLYFDVKEPGEPLLLRTEKLHFHYQDVFGRIPEAYETLLFDVMRGDHTLFVRNDEAEAAWGAWEPILQNKPQVFSYQAFSWGPKEADKLLIRDGKQWFNP